MLDRFSHVANARLFVALALGTTILAAVAVGGSFAQVGRTFPGFVVWNNLVVAPLGRPTWSGIREQVPFRSRVVRVDGQAVHTRNDLERIVAGASAGATHRYVFADRRGEETRIVASMRLGWPDWAATFGVYALNGAVFLLTGLAVFYLKPESSQSRALLVFGSVWGLTLLLAIDLFTTGRLAYAYFVLEALWPVATLHLALVFPEQRLRTSPPLVWLYALGLAVGLVQVWAFARAHPLLLPINAAVYLAVAGAGVAAMLSIAVEAFGPGRPRVQRQARVVLAGAVTAFGIPLLALLAFFLLGRPVSFSLLTLTGFIFPLSIGYAVARHDLFEADRFVKLSLVYAVLTAVVSLAYATAVLVAEQVAAGFTASGTPLFPIVFVLVALATIVPLRDRVQRAVDRLFYRGRVDYKATVARASQRMTTLLDRTAIVRHVVTTLRDVLFLGRVSVWERDGDVFVQRGADELHSLPADDPGLVAFLSLQRPLSVDEAEESPQLRFARDALTRLFDTTQSSLLVPLVHQGRPTGLITVSSKVSGAPLSADDVDVLRTLANETAAALATAAAVKQLAVTRDQLAQADRLAAIGELSAAVAHGIRNPLAGIRIAAQLGLEGLDAISPVRENLEDVLTAVQKLDGQVEGILNFARPFEPKLERMDLRALVADLIQTMTLRLAARRVTLQVEGPDHVPPILGDHAHLGQVIEELVANAVDAMPDGGTVNISLAPVGDGRRRVQLAISDSGLGVPPQLQQRIFQLFTTTKETGTGVGLAVTRKIIERHGGTIALETVAPNGARFVIELPAS